MPLTEAGLIARVLGGDDRNAYGELVRRHQSAVRCFLRRLTRDDARADDLAQEAFLQAYRSLGSYRGGGRFSSWLLRIAYRGFLSDARKRGVAMVTEAVELDESAPLPETLAADPVVLRHDLERAMSALSVDDRAALSLTYAEDVTHQEAAEILGWPLGTLKTRVLRAKARLREELQGYAEEAAR